VICDLTRVCAKRSLDPVHEFAQEFARVARETKACTLTMVRLYSMH